MKKLFALALSVLMILGAFCSCTPNNVNNNSSQIASEDLTSIVSSNPSTEETSSINLNPDGVKETDVPPEEIASYLFDKSTDYIVSFICAEITDAVMFEFGGEIERGTRYDSNGNILDHDASVSYIKSNRTYDDAKAHYAKTFTGDMLNEFMDAYFIDIDGYLGVLDGGGATGITYDNLNLEYQGYKNGIHNYIAHYNFCEWDVDTNDHSRTPTKTAFAIALTDDGYRVCQNEYCDGIWHWF